MERYKCEICGGDSSYEHDWCDALLYRMESNKLREQQKKERLLEDNPWLGFFKYNFDKWANSHPNYMLDK